MFIIFLIFLVLAMFCYSSVFFRIVTNRGFVTNRDINILLLGVILDVIATIGMALSAQKGISLHAFFGYVALFLAVVWLVMTYCARHFQVNKSEWSVRLLGFTYIAYPFWMIVFFISAIAKR